MSKAQSRVAYAEDAEEDSGSDYDVIEGTRKYARSEAPTELSKERPNTGKSRSEKRPEYRHSRSPSLTDSDEESDDSDGGERLDRRMSQMDERELRELERRRAAHRRAEEDRVRTMQGHAQPLKKNRPSPLKHSATVPVVQQAGYRRGHVDDPSFYGVHQQPAVAGSRPRAKTRPASYYAGQASRPPMAGHGMNWMPGHPAPAPSPMPFPVGTFPPQQHQMYPIPSPGSRGAPIPSPGTMGGYFDRSMSGGHNPALLKQRFDMRPSSAIGFQSQGGPMGFPPGHDPRGMPPPPHTMARRPSASRQQKDMDDRRKMPPPDFIPKRPQSAALPPSTPFRPPQRPPSRQQQPSRTAHRRPMGLSDKRRGYDDDDFGGDDGLFHDISPQPNSEQRRQNISRTRRALVRYDEESEDEDEDEDDYDESYGLVPADPRGRRGSLYGTRGLGTGGVSLDEDKYLDAIRYQNDLQGPNMPLTAETLRRVAKPRGVPSSRSTRSSASRDDSDYKRSSNTTGITKSSSAFNSDDVTIKLSGGAALVTMGNGAEMDVAGGEIRFRSRPTGSRMGSDHASTVYQIEEPRGRYERKALPQRSRAPSQSEAQGGRYLAHAPYEPAFADNYF